MNFEKYRKADTIKLHGIYGDIYQEYDRFLKKYFSHIRFLIL